MPTSITRTDRTSAAGSRCAPCRIAGTSSPTRTRACATGGSSCDIHVLRRAGLKTAYYENPLTRRSVQAADAVICRHASSNRWSRVRPVVFEPTFMPTPIHSRVGRERRRRPPCYVGRLDRRKRPNCSSNSRAAFPTRASSASAGAGRRLRPRYLRQHTVDAPASSWSASSTSSRRRVTSGSAARRWVLVNTSAREGTCLPSWKPRASLRDPVGSRSRRLPRAVVACGAGRLRRRPRGASFEGDLWRSKGRGRLRLREPPLRVGKAMDRQVGSTPRSPVAAPADEDPAHRAVAVAPQPGETACCTSSWARSSGATTRAGSNSLRSARRRTRNASPRRRRGCGSSTRGAPAAGPADAAHRRPT